MSESRVDVFGGVDTHRDTHVAAVVDGAGRLLGSESFAAEETGYRRMVACFELRGRLVRVGVEGTGSYGAGLARYLTGADIEVVEVNRPNRQLRRQKGGKTDSVDAEGQLGRLPAVRQPRFLNLVTGRSSVYGCCWWFAAPRPRPVPKPLTRYILCWLPPLSRSNTSSEA